MNRISSILLFIFSVTIILSSCSVEKRVYMKGYNVDWFKGKNKIQEKTLVKKEKDGSRDILRLESKASREGIASVDRDFSLDINTVDIPSFSIEKERTPSHQSVNTIEEEGGNKVLDNSHKIQSDWEADESNLIMMPKTTKESSSQEEVSKGLLYVLCILIPFVAVGLATDWDVKPVIYNLLWSLLCGIPGIIHAFIVVSRER